MDIKSIVNNIKKRGLRETLKAIQKKQKTKFRIKKQKQKLQQLADPSAWPNTLIGQEKLLTYLLTEIDWTNAEERREPLDLLISLLSNYENREQAATLIENAKSKPSDSVVRSYCIKSLFPKLYTEKSRLPLEHKAVIMENGGPLSPSQTYMRDYLLKYTDFKVEVYTLLIRQVPELMYYANARKYIEAAATAEAIFNCTANILMGHLKLRPETTYIQLWHGCGALKKCGLSTIGKSFGKSRKSHEEYPQNTNYSYVTIASPEFFWIFEDMMGLKKDSGIIVPTGISRTDVFFDEEYKNSCYRKLYEIIPEAIGKKIILYAPTFRGDVIDCYSPDRLDTEKFAKALGENYILIFKHHQAVKVLPAIPEKLEGRFAFDMTNSNVMNINDLLTVSDILISDYSSVIFEFALFERPMIFYTFDIEEYSDIRGLYYNFRDIVPGPMFDNNDDMIDYIQHIEERFDKKEVTAFKEKFMSCCDGHATERIVSLIGKKTNM